eukprot:365300-Chlamydomonas_euryale.AAC.2
MPTRGGLQHGHPPLRHRPTRPDRPDRTAQTSRQRSSVAAPPHPPLRQPPPLQRHALAASRRASSQHAERQSRLPRRLQGCCRKDGAGVVVVATRGKRRAEAPRSCRSAPRRAAPRRAEPADPSRASAFALPPPARSALRPPRTVQVGHGDEVAAPRAAEVGGQPARCAFERVREVICGSGCEAPVTEDRPSVAAAASALLRRAAGAGLSVPTGKPFSPIAVSGTHMPCHAMVCALSRGRFHWGR